MKSKSAPTGQNSKEELSMISKAAKKPGFPGVAWDGTGRIGRHMSLPRHLIQHVLDTCAPEDIRRASGFTDNRAEALVTLAADPREVFSPCDNTDDRGACQGHGSR